MKYIVVLTLSLLFVIDVMALQLKPLSVRLHDYPGEVIEGSIEVGNEKDKPIDLFVELVDESVTKEQFPNWLSIDKTEIRLKPQERTTINYKASIPEKSAGLFISKLSFSELNPKAPGMVQIITKLSMFITAIVKGTEIYQAEIETIKLSPSSPKKLLVSVGVAYHLSRES